MNLADTWLEYAFLALLIIGFILAASSGSAVISYVIIGFVGFLSSSSLYHRKKGFKFPTIVILLGFLIGYILGSFYGNRKIIIVLFALGYLLGYYCHHRGWIK